MTDKPGEHAADDVRAAARLSADGEGIAHRLEVYGSREGRGAAAASWIRDALSMLDALPKLLAERQELLERCDAIKDKLTQRVDANDRAGRALLAARAELDRLRAENLEMREACGQLTRTAPLCIDKSLRGHDAETCVFCCAEAIRAILGRERGTET